MSRRLQQGSRLILASHNRGKLQELAALVAIRRIAVAAAPELGLAEPEECASDFAGNARIKALAAARATGLPALADDSGFCVAALHGAPGILSARWAGPEKDFKAAMDRVQAAGAGDGDRAWFACALCLAWPDSHSATFLGRVEGRIAWPPRGTRGFGYDPMFVPAGGEHTFGELDPAEKEAASHRARAFAALFAACL